MENVKLNERLSKSIYMERKINLETISALSKTKIRNAVKVKSTKGLLKEAQKQGIDLGKRKETQEKRAFDYFGSIYNNEIEEKNNLIKQRRKDMKKIKKTNKFRIGKKSILYDQFDKFKDNKNIRIQVINDGKMIRDYQHNLKKDGKLLNKMIQPLLKNYDETIFENLYPNAELFITQGTKPIKKDLLEQFFKDGKINCVMKPIINFIEDKIETSMTKKTKQNYNSRLKKALKLEEKYHDTGVNEDALNEISNDLQVDLSVVLPFQNDYMEAKSNKKPLRSFKYINTRMNHVEYDELSYNEKTEIISQNEMIKLKNKLNKNNEYYTYKKNYMNVSEIRTIDTIYRLPNEFNDIVNDFENKSGLCDVKICDIKNEDVSKFVRQGNHFNETIDINNYKKTTPHNHIDMEKAYSKFYMSKYYKGFLGKITDFRKCDHIVDVGYYRIINIKFVNNWLKVWNDKLKIYKDYNVYTSPELEMLKDNGVEFDIIEGCWGDNIDFRFNDELINGYEIIDDDEKVRYYSKYVGIMSSKNLQRNMYINGDEQFINNLNNKFENIDVYGNEVKISYDKKSNYHLSHISGFILSYMRMNMLEQLEQFKTEDVYRVVVDGIYFKKIDVDLKNCFRYEEKEFKNNDGGLSYISNPKDYDFEAKLIHDKNYTLSKADFRENNKIELHLGCGGSGKTHYNLNDKGFINPTYYAPSWKLVRNKQKETGVYSNTIAKITSDDPIVVSNQRKFVSTLIIDEVSMMTEKDKQKIIKNFPNCKIIFCGDIGFQLPPIDKGDEFKIDTMKIINHNKNYRVKDDNFLEILNNCRDKMKKGHRIKEYVISKLNKVKDMDYNHTTDMIITGTHKTKDLYTDKYKHLDKYYITKSDRVYGRGEIYLEKPETEHYVLQHAYTTHSIQGETATGKLFIDMENIWENRMIYTMISRAKTLDQIYII